jgi:hypothetical protein
MVELEMLGLFLSSFVIGTTLWRIDRGVPKTVRCSIDLAVELVL